MSENTTFAQPAEASVAPVGELVAELIKAPSPLDPIPRATLNDLQNKKRARREIAVEIPGEDGPKRVSFLFIAISRKEYDALIDQFPPTKVQQAKGEAYDIDRFAPALLNKVIAEPYLEVSDWTGIWKSPEWSIGEAGGLFYTAVGLCQTGFEMVPTTAGD